MCKNMKYWSVQKNGIRGKFSGNLGNIIVQKNDVLRLKNDIIKKKNDKMS